MITENDTTTTLLVPEALQPEQALASSRDYEEQLARWHALIRSGALPKHIDTPAKAVAIAAMGAEFGWPPMRSLQSIYLVEGRPTLSAQSMLALVLERCEHARVECLESSTATCKLKARRYEDGAWLEVEFSADDARAAGLLGKRGKVWSAYRSDMLWARAVSRLCRRMFPDVIAGAYVHGELDAAPEPKQRPRGQANDAAAAALLGTTEEGEA